MTETIAEIAKLSLRLVDGRVISLFRRDRDRLSAREEQLNLLQDLTAAQIDSSQTASQLSGLYLVALLDRPQKWLQCRRQGCA
jgi:hypothetical protein